MHLLRANRYALNVYFNLLNKSIFKYFPFPYTVSTVHVVVGTAYCALVYLLGMKNLSFGRVSAVGFWLATVHFVVCSLQCYCPPLNELTHALLAPVRACAIYKMHAA